MDFDLKKWRILGKITDKDLGFNFPEQEPNGCRFNVRVILKSSDNKICLIRSEKHDYYQVPGGGIDPGESIKQGLEREIIEETGFRVKNFKPIGVIVEHRSNNKYNWNRAISYCFVAEPGLKIGTNYTEYENEEKFVPTWIDLDDALEIFQQADKKLKHEYVRSYSGAFATRRDLLLLKAVSSVFSPFPNYVE